MFNWAQAGVDHFADGTIVNADIHSSANIQSDKLNLTAIAQSVANSGSTTLTGTFAANGTTNSIGNGGSDVLTLNVPGGMTLSAATTWTLTGALTFSGTIANLGTVTTADINGGTIDGVTIGGSVAPTVTNVDINGGTIDGMTIGATVAPTVTNLGTVTTADINGGTIDGMTIGATVAPTVTNLGTVTTADINGGTIDGVPIGGASAAAGTFTTLNATGGGALTGTWTDHGSITTVDINGGTIDGVQVGGTTATGELIVNDASDDADGLGSQGTSGQFLQSAGAGANPTWVTVGSKLLSATAVASGNSGNITIAANKLYLVVFEIITSGTPAEIGLRFNSDESAASYDWGANPIGFHTTPAITAVGNNSDTEISLTNGGAASANPFSGNFYIDTTLKNAQTAFVWGMTHYRDNAASKDAIASFGGRYLDNTTITDFELFSTMTLTGDIYVYEFQLTP